MNMPIVATTVEPIARPARHASFLGMMRGEFLKVARLFWLMLAILTLGFVVAFLLGANSENATADLRHTPLHFLYNSLESNMVIVRILGGIFLLILTSFTIGREYQYGTIRILLARGAGRIQLLLAKLAMLALIALALLALFTLFTALLTCILILALVGNLNALNAITPTFWFNIGIDLLTVITSMGATILLAAAMNALGRSLTFGLSASLVWFPLDNTGTLVMNVIAQLTHSDFWRTITSYLLGPLLNRLPDIWLSQEAQSAFASFGVPPLVPVSASHALWVICAYALIFLVLALVPTWKRDVKE
ncbi:MAG: ABC transporter permease subunit [Ktedonobacteraceae bacterium]|nr:ABC transporter permease subunit [Ktedonobacteraceae bacterium]